jgi:hypothetical protein
VPEIEQQTLWFVSQTWTLVNSTVIGGLHSGSNVGVKGKSKTALPFWTGVFCSAETGFLAEHFQAVVGASHVDRPSVDFPPRQRTSRAPALPGGSSLRRSLVPAPAPR